MKHLKDFIYEQREQTLSEAKSNRQEIRIEVKDLEGSEEFLKDLKSKLDDKGIYNEKIDNGLKFAIQGDDKEKYQSILDLLKGYENGAEKLESQISKFEKWLTEEEPKEDSEKNKEDKKEDE